MIKRFQIAYCVPGTVLSTSVNSLKPHNNILGRFYYYYHHLTNEETEIHGDDLMNPSHTTHKSRGLSSNPGSWALELWCNIWSWTLVLASELLKLLDFPEK